MDIIQRTEFRVCATLSFLQAALFTNPFNLYPFVNGWASSKLAGFVFYVLSTTFALKWAKSMLWRVVGFVSAVFWLVMSARLGFADHFKVKSASEEVSMLIETAQSLLAIVC